MLRYFQAIKIDENARLISYMAGLKMQSTTLARIHQIVSSNLLERHQLERLRVALDAIYSYENNKFGKVFIGEYQFALDYLNEIMGPTFLDRYNYYKNMNDLIEKYSSDEDEDIGFQRRVSETIFMLFPHYYLHPNEVKAALLPYYQNLQASGGYYCNVPDINATDETYPDNWKTMIMPNSMTKQWILAKANWQQYFYRTCFFHTYKDAVQTIIAMHLYQIDKGVMPSETNELVPDYLAAEPVDYFSGEKLHYSTDKQWFYSVGADFKDDGGSSGGIYDRTGICEEDTECYKNPTIPYIFPRGGTNIN
jgi:hypothetical protein